MSGTISVLDRLEPSQFRVSVCQYESLLEYPAAQDEDGNEVPSPSSMDGKEVVGVEDGYIVVGLCVGTTRHSALLAGASIPWWNGRAINGSS